MIDAHGQRVSATDRLYLLEAVPTLIAWGERDRTIPLEHGRAAHAAVPHSHFVTFPGAAHFPHLEAPAELAAALDEFIAATEPASLDEDAWRSLLRRRSEVRRRPRFGATGARLVAKPRRSKKLQNDVDFREARSSSQ